MTRRRRGFSLVELMIALTVLSLGLLGAWSLLISSLRGHVDARRHAAATSLVRDMAERIRANPSAGARYDSDAPAAGDVACDAPAPCDVPQRAASDLAHFARAAQELFPAESSARVEFVPATGPAAADRYVITLRWRGSRDEDSVSLQLLAPPVAG
jgi:type IV pilus assembly protein PilV